MDDFIVWADIKDSFYKFGFTKISHEEAILKLKDVNTQKFIIWGNDIKNKGILCNIYFLQNNTYYQQLGLSLVITCEDRIEINCVYNKKGDYFIEIFGNNIGEDKSTLMIEYKVNIENDAETELKFPREYFGANAIKLIEPLCNVLKQGEKVKFKMELDLDTIIIMDGTWHYLKKK